MSAAIQATAATGFPPALKPTMYFIGVTTAQSSIMRVFPRWAEYLKLGDVALRGIDCKVHDEPVVYQRVVDFIKRDPRSLGALVTTHKLDLLRATRDRFDELDAFAERTHEISSISKHGKRLVGHAKDPITSGLALESFLPREHWRSTGAEMLILGAGGSSTALSSYVIDPLRGPCRPKRLHVCDRSADRLLEIRQVHQAIGRTIPIEYHRCGIAAECDQLVARMPAGSVIVNATGLGKDAPGSPVTDAALFPEDGYAWEFNYRGDLVFLGQARGQAASRSLHVEDGWVYFLHGWTRVIAEVFHIDIPTHGPVFDELSRIAKETR